MDGPEHYFTAAPASDGELRTRRVDLAGRALTVRTAGGVFSPDHVDHATRVLLDHVPDPPADGDLLDLGCGWGPLALTMALLSPAARVWAVDVNARALDLVRRNAPLVAPGTVLPALPDEVPATTTFTALWSNPPVRVGKPALHALLLRWLPRLAPGASAHLVVGRNLGADPLQRWLVEQGWDCTRTASSKGFRVLEVRATSRQRSSQPSS
ncbi:class I SAM-dependent methyltransferase [Cellulomonas marina]|uniref:Methyltransferase small domain-containing protein n=1 Tax=Cellulomonas marina TaxID=988821 RepID=A0A1I0VJ53_9CELL|nr:methyltransferase [Cellulomonas marina]GIG27934.1 16S RNA G1207 methylase RsmC [Cellulomonas marina]SFA76342.1 Methyltransferase small domain-containing protein [Cellulomonas marina]